MYAKHAEDNFHINSTRNISFHFFRSFFEKVDNELKAMSEHNFGSLTNYFPTEGFDKAEFLTLFTQNWPENNFHLVGERKKNKAKAFQNILFLIRFNLVAIVCKA